MSSLPALWSETLRFSTTATRHWLARRASLSGGQKQRISLARAVYSNSKHLILDDCLSAVDSHTAQWIFNNCIMGPLMRDRTCILVSHNIPLCVPHSDFVVTMNNGRVVDQGTPEELVKAGKLGEEIIRSRPGSAHVSRVPSRVPSSVGEESGNTLLNEPDAVAGDSASKPAKKSAEEARCYGRKQVYWCC